MKQRLIRMNKKIKNCYRYKNKNKKNRNKLDNQYKDLKEYNKIMNKI